MNTVWVVAALVASYLAGSTPTAYIAGRLLKGIDLRTVGSGNLGATNVYRTLGGWAAAAVLAIDMAKGAAATVLLSTLAPVDVPGWGALCGLAAIGGHIRPYFGRFKGGGKGVATASGVFAALSPAAFGIGTSVFLVTLAATRFVSLGSMLGGVALALSAALIYGPRSYITLASTLVAGLVLYTHRANLTRLRRGQEPKLGKPGGAR